MTLRNNIMAILESCFSGYKEELIAHATDRILWQVERQKPEKIFVEGIEYTRVADTPQTDCGKPIECEGCGEHICIGCEHQAKKKAWRKAQTDCGWK